MNDLTHIDLFSGIGGFALAAGWAGFRTIAFCEIDPFCREVLKARFGAVADTECRVGEQPAGSVRRTRRRGETPGNAQPPILIPDIRDFDGARFRGATLLTGGVPCQPASVAGKRRGKEDDRWLWPEALRILAEVKPIWAIFENPPGILSLERGMVFEELLSQMEADGYEIWPVVIPAVGVNAPHRRMRVWIIANRQGERLEGRGDGGEGVNPETVRLLSTRPDSDAPVPPCGKPRQPPEQEGRQDTRRGNSKGGDAPDAEGNSERTGLCEGESGREWRGRPSDLWGTPWIEVATRFCRVDDGLPAWIHARRVVRLKALGNAIVPEIAYQIIKGIAEIEEGA